MVAVQVQGNHAAIALAGSQGNFELNVFKPVIIHNFMHSALLLADTCTAFSRYCVDGLKAAEAKIREYLQNSLMLVTALSPVLGYDRCAKIAHAALADGSTLRAACLKLVFLSGEEFDRYVDPARMTHP